MFSRNRKPLTQPQGDRSEPDAKETPSQHRQKIKFLRSLPIIRNLWLLFQEHKREPFTWVLLAYCTTLLLAANTLKDPHAEELVSLRKLSTARAPMINGTIIKDGLEPIGGDSWLSLFLSSTDSSFSNGTSPEAHKKHSRLHFHQVRKMSPRDVVEQSHGHRRISTARERTLREHPISTLIREAEGKARQIETKINSIESYADAVEDYKNAFGMEPPRGFEGWYNFAKKHNCITAPSLLSGAHLSVKPYLAYDPDLLRRRMNQMTDKNSGTWYFDLGKTQGLSDMNRDVIRIGGGAKGNFRARDMRKLINPLLSYIPEQIPGDGDLRLVFSVHDGPAAQSSWTLVERSRQLAGRYLVWEKEDLAAVERQQSASRGWPFVCNPESPLAKQSRDRVLNDEVSPDPVFVGKEKSFIEDHVATFDYCQNPSLVNLHGTMIVNERWGSVMTPVISYCKTLHNTDVMGVALDNMNKTVREMKWEDKTIDKVIWRGSFTGAFHNSRWNWQNSQRERIVDLANLKEGDVEVLVHVGKRIQRMKYPVEALNELFLDIAPVGGAVQCDGEACDELLSKFEFASMMSPETAAKYKYTIDLDGNGWSSRFRRLLTSTSVVLKSTIFPEWYSDILIPWYHYVPLKVDYSDIYDIMVYFGGTPDGIGGHDVAARKIAEHARDFAVKRWRWEDMQSYMLLTILEYQRMLSHDRHALDILAIRDHIEEDRRGKLAHMTLPRKEVKRRVI